MNPDREWHQNAWQYLNKKQGVQNEHNKEHPTDVGAVDVTHDVSAKRDRVVPMKIKLTLAIVSWSVGFVLTAALACKKDYIDGPAGACTAYMPQAEGASPDESAKWVSDEKPPRNPQPAWETGEVKADNLQNTDVAKRSPPDSCKGEHQVWTGARCIEGEEPGAGKKPQ
jgi:hypothetical protein